MTAATEAGRVLGVDVARAVAALVMVQGHAYHAWVADPHRDTAAYGFTRLLGTLPLPAFLLLAGGSLGLRVRAAVARQDRARELRRTLLRRGAELVGVGYLVNVAFALMDGAEGASTLLRTDVLHVIGLSICSVAWLGVRGDAQDFVQLATLRRATLWLCAVPTLLCPWLSPLGARVPEALAPLAALLVDVPGFTRMPWVPLVSWLAAGTLLAVTPGLFGSRAPHADAFAARAGVRGRHVVALLAAALALSAGSQLATDRTLAALGGPLTRAHPAVVFNVLDGAGRAGVVLAVGLGLAGLAQENWARTLARVGQSSLWIYVGHLPFCYGRAGRPLWHALDMGQATLYLLPLLLGSVVLALTRSRARERARRNARPARAAVT